MAKFILTRRELLRLCGSACVVSLFGGTKGRADKMVNAKAAVDHLLLGVSDLDHGIAWVEKMTAVKAITGGSHPGAGTRNALISLGGRQYLEIIAPDPLQTTYNSPVDVRKLIEPRLITWAALTTDINATAKKAQESGYQIFGPRDGSRARPDGKILKWKVLGLMNNFRLQGIEPVPFFIEWAGDSLHPSQDSPRGCDLLSFDMEHPDPAGVIEALKKIGIKAKVSHAKEARLRAMLKTPKGKVELS